MAQDGLWTSVSKNTIQPYVNGRSTAAPLPTNYELVKLNRNQLQLLQKRAPLVKLGERSSVSPVRLNLPLPAKGQTLASAFTESPILSNELSKQLTGFKTYELKDPGTNALQGRLTITSQGVTGLIFTDKGSAYIYPVSPDYPDVHMVYYVKDLPVTQPILCSAKEVVEGKNGAGARVATVLASDCQLRNYRLAVAATGEYTAWAGGSQTQALIYIGTLINDVTAIYERDAGITFTLVSNNSIIFTNAATDPYDTHITNFPDGTTLNNNTSTLNAALGSGNYDEGIVLSKDWNGGLAYLSAVCNNGLKGGGAAGLTFGTGSNPAAGPQGSIFTGTVAHEMAHQFSAQHTMASGHASCGNGNVNPPTGYEPGGGSTIMAYAGSCGSPDAYQNNSDLYFHGYSILQIANYSVNSATCRPATPMSNAAPAVSVPAGTYTIPVSTPFMLTATGTDANNPTLYYCWEQLDAGTDPSGTSGTPVASSTNGPLFRSFPPTTANTRVFPRMADLVSGAATPFEVLPSVTRPLNFMVMVRDEATGGGCTAQTSVTVNTDASAGPFTVTSQSSATSWAANGSNTATVTWNVAGSNAAPVNCSNVDIILSKDGGVTYIDTLVKNTANDGTETFTIPNLPTSIGRIMVKARGNIFFNINSAFITITSSCSANGTSFTPGTAVTGAAGNSTLDLSLSPVYGSAVTISGSLDNTDPSTDLTFLNTSTNTCVDASNLFQYDTYRFTPSVTGSYTFFRSAGNGNLVFNLYSDAFVPGAPCTNFINSSGRWPGSGGVSNGNPYAVTLTAGLYYTVAVGTFASGTPGLPSPYTIGVTPPAGGGLFTNTPSPGAGFNYTYVIVDNATGLIKAFDASSNLSNASNYPVGTSYTLYGLSYSNAVSVATLNTYVGTSFSSFKNVLLFNPSALCGSASANNMLVTVTAVLSKTAQMLPLTATKVGNTVNLKWAATSSEKTSYFEIWRSADGTTFNELIGTVPAQNSTSSRIDYELNDNSPLAAWNYYRVKQFDVDDNETLGNIARVNMQEKATPSTLTVYPNPVTTSSLILAYNATSVETVGVRVLNGKGSLVYQSVFTAQNGANQYKIPAGALPKGVYIVQLVSNSGSYISRFVKE
ncbi:MAG: reprolysin-like metallopeptidase [Niastella sp.]|uniref:reprolysin-like metallopeptidase n=1 Tax=Niastella sp. TaxID=1869183 RepID=UPI003899E7EF